MLDGRMAPFCPGKRHGRESAVTTRRMIVIHTWNVIGLVLAGAALFSLDASTARAQASPQRTYANPIDIDYKYNFEQHNEGISYRSGADPVIVVQGGKYYLFETIGDGYW